MSESGAEHPHVVVMAKVPVPGRVKTRLIPLLGADGAAGLCRAMTEDTLAMVRSYEGLRWRVALDGDLDDPWVRGLGAAVEPQASGDLGARLRHALRDGGIAIGTDSPTLPRGFLHGAMLLLRQDQVVFGPAFDGGYVLVGVRGPEALGVFDSIPWSTAETCAASVERARALHLTCGTLGFWYDVDTPADLTFLRNHLRTLDPTVAPHTRAFLQDSPHAAPHR
jgi:rSAM/selenodomain-associated transferase 1